MSWEEVQDAWVTLVQDNWTAEEYRRHAQLARWKLSEAVRQQARVHGGFTWAHRFVRLWVANIPLEEEILWDAELIRWEHGEH